MNDADLTSMSVQDLRALRDRVDAAIRAGIARSRLAHPTVAQQPQPEAQPSIDLERERDAWQARRR